MFKVEICQKEHYWNKFTFNFETLEEAQQFVKDVLKNYVKEEDDEDIVVYIEFKQKYTTAEKEEDESNIGN